MAIVQISKIQQRSGNLVDLPQLDEAEFGWASDAKLLYIGKTTPNENVEVLTSYSHISFSQLDGSVGNLNISDATVANGQVLAFDGTNWVNKGGDAGGLITLGSVSNVKITGGAIGYVLETDGTGNLSWTPKGTISASILSVTNANPGVVTTTTNNLFTDGLKVTITDARGMTQLNGNTYYADVISSNTFALYSDASLSTPVNTSAFTAYAYTNVSNTYSSNNALKVGNSSSFTVNYPVMFVGDMTGTNLGNTATYYIKTIPSSTAITVSAELLPNGVAGNVVVLANATVTANVYGTGGRILSSLVSSGGGGGNAAGSSTSVQYNAGGLLGGSSDFTFDNSTKIATVNGNINTSNVNASNAVTASRFVSNVATGTAPLTVTSTTLVPNLYVARANISDYSLVSSLDTGIYYPTFVTGNAGSVYKSLVANGIFSANLANGSLSATTFVGNLTGGANTANTVVNATQPNITGVSTSGGTFTVGNLSNSGVFFDGQSGVTLNSKTGAVEGAQLTMAWKGVSGITGQANATWNIDIDSANNYRVFYQNATGGQGVPITAYSSNSDVTFAGNTTTNGNVNTSGNVVVSSSVNAPYVILNTYVANNKRTGLTYAANGLIQFETGVDVALNNSRNYYIYDSVSAATRLLIDPTGNVGVGNGAPVHKLSVDGTMFVSGNANIGNLGASAFYGSGIGLTSVPGANVTGTVANATYATSAGSALSATTAGTVTTNAQPNITSVGNLSTLTVTGSSNLASGAGNVGVGTTTPKSKLQVTGLASLTAPVLGTANNAPLYVTSTDTAYGLVAGVNGSDGHTWLQAQRTDGTAIAYNLTINEVGGNVGIGNAAPTHTLSVSGTTSVSGNANVGNLGTTGVITATGNITGGNLVTTRTVSAGNLALANNATVSGTLSVTGNTSLTGANVSLGAISNVKMTGGSSGFVLITDGTGNLTFSNPVTIGTQPAGANTQVQFNDGGSLGAVSTFTFTKTTNNLYSGGNVIAASGLYGALLSTTGNGTISGNLSVGANTFITLSANIGGALDVSGVTTLKNGVNVTAGNITASSGRFIGNGSGLTSIIGANVTGTVANATYATSAGSAATVAGPNVTGYVPLADYATNAGWAINAGNATNATNATTAAFSTNSGYADRADTADLVSTATNANYYLLIASTSASANGAVLYNQSSVYTNASNGALYATKFVGSGAGLTGTASSLTAGGAGYATIAGTAYAVSGANVSGTVSSASYAASAGTASSATTVNSITSSQVTTALGFTPVSNSSFPSVQGTDGYCTLPNGLKMVWGRGGYVGQDQSIYVSFTYTFPNACLNVQVTPLASSLNNSGGGENSVYNISVSGFTYYHGQDTGAYPMYFAIGY